MANEAEPLLRKKIGADWRSATLAITLTVYVICILLLAARPSLISSGHDGQLLQYESHKRPNRREVLYEDWRGLSQEAEDAFTFVHTWSGAVPVGEREEQEIDPTTLRIDFTDGAKDNNAPFPSGVQGPAGSPATANTNPVSRSVSPEIKSKLEQGYNTFLVGDSWSERFAKTLLSEFEDLCGFGLAEPQTAVSCDLSQARKWALKQEPIADDIFMEGDTVSVSSAGALGPSSHSRLVIDSFFRSAEASRVVSRCP